MQKLSSSKFDSLKDLLANRGVGIAVTDLEGRFLETNQAYSTITGYDVEQLRKLDLLSITHPDDRHGSREQLQRLISGELPACILQTRYRTKKGESICVQSNASLLRNEKCEATNMLFVLSPDPEGNFRRVGGVAQDITERKTAESALHDFSRRLLEAQETERKNIARELHDEIGQVLTAVRFNLQRLKQHYEAASEITDSVRVVDEALTRVRDLSLELRPALLDDLGLAVTARWYVDRYGSRVGIKIEVDIDNDLEENRLPRDVEIACFRILQESLTNVARHARARHVKAQLTIKDSTLVLRVKDDGIGMRNSAEQHRPDGLTTLGIKGMEERALAASGFLEIFSEPFRGTEVRATFPLHTLETSKELVPEPTTTS